MKCKIQNRDRLINAYIAGDLPIDEMKFFVEHDFNCDVCFKELMIK